MRLRRREDSVGGRTRDLKGRRNRARGLTARMHAARPRSLGRIEGLRATNGLRSGSTSY